MPDPDAKRPAGPGAGLRTRVGEWLVQFNASFPGASLDDLRFVRENVPLMLTRIAVLEGEVARLRALADIAAEYVDNGGTIALMELRQAIRDYRAALAGKEG